MDLIVILQDYKLEGTNRFFMNIMNIFSIHKIISFNLDNRELIPEFFSKTEYYLNLNCD